MCLIALAWQSHPRYALVMVANRDEFYDRPSAPAHWWPDRPGVLAGRDLQAGGTWLAVSQGGRWAAVTNYREGQPQAGLHSRGELPPAFVSDTATAEDFTAQLATRGAAYGGFNLLAGDGDTLAWLSNRKAGGQLLSAGVHTLSNHLLNTPWPKAELVRLKLQKLLHRDELSVDELLAVMADRVPFDDHCLPVTGLGLAQERVLSPPFIVADGYGTRCTTVLLVDHQGQISLAEQTFEGGQKAGPPKHYQFSATQNPESQ